MSKLDSYLPVYNKHFKEYADKSVKLLEIGVQSGSSIAMWRNDYPKWDVWGMDIDPHCAGHQIIIGDQTNKSLLESLGQFDIVIDDGGHTMHQQITSFETLFPNLRSGGLYVVEDLHTSYWPKFFDLDITAMQYFKNLADTIQVMAHDVTRTEGNRVPENKYGIASIHFYPSLIFIYKL